MDVVDEETPLLPPPAQPTPLPWAQFSIVLFLQMAEPLTSNVIYPFAPDLIRNIGITNGNEKKIGYYVGLMQSMFFLTEAIFVYHWSRLSDRIGRKPVILTGLLGLSLSMYAFGLSSTFFGLLLSRGLNGALNGNVGVIKSMTAELTDATNIAHAYAYAPVTWSTGASLGPMIGGFLSRPADRFPTLFGSNSFLKTYPYFLPCFVPATFSFIALVVAAIFLKETVRNPVPISHLIKKPPEKAPTWSDEQPLSLRAVMTPQVFIAALNYATLSLVDIAFRAIQPVFLSTPVQDGGLGLSTPSIGSVLCASGILHGVFQVLLFARIHNRWGSKTVFCWGTLASFPVFILFPVMNWFARSSQGSYLVWFALGTQIAFSLIANLSYGAIFIVIADASPNRASLGTTNGVCQTTVSIMRAIGPAITNSLFSLTIENGYLAGQLVYIVLLGLVGLSFYTALLLPGDGKKGKRY